MYTRSLLKACLFTLSLSLWIFRRSVISYDRLHHERRSVEANLLLELNVFNFRFVYGELTAVIFRQNFRAVLISSFECETSSKCSLTRRITWSWHNTHYQSYVYRLIYLTFRQKCNYIRIMQSGWVFDGWQSVYIEQTQLYISVPLTLFTLDSIP